MAKSFKYTAVLCEDIRQEVGNKHTIVGAWFGDLIMAELPGNIRIAVLMVLENLSTGHHDAKAELRLNKKTVAGVNFAMEVNADEPILLTLPMGLLAMVEPADLSVCISVDGSRMTSIASSKIRLASGAPTA